MANPNWREFHTLLQ